jgi:uncharacterized membrane protein YkvA (DUF1232 family)
VSALVDGRGPGYRDRPLEEDNMSGSEGDLAVLQGFVDQYATDVADALAALGSANVPAAAKRLLVGALNYGLDLLDIFPDNYQGLGVADDGMVLRLAAAQAQDAGATDERVARLAADAASVREMFAKHAAGLDRLVASLPDRNVHGRTADRILAEPDARAMFEGEVSRSIQRFKPTQIDTQKRGANVVRKELDMMVEHALKKAGLS